jgi:hypothetical protein
VIGARTLCGRKPTIAISAGETNYEETSLTVGEMLTLETLGITLETDWLLLEPRPAVRATLERLLNPPS